MMKSVRRYLLIPRYRKIVADIGPLRGTRCIGRRPFSKRFSVTLIMASGQTDYFARIPGALPQATLKIGLQPGNSVTGLCEAGNRRAHRARLQNFVATLCEAATGLLSNNNSEAAKPLSYGGSQP